MFIHCLGTDNVEIASATPCTWSGVDNTRLRAHCCGSNTLGHGHATPSLLRAIDNATVVLPMPWQHQCFCIHIQTICTERRIYAPSFVLPWHRQPNTHWTAYASPCARRGINKLTPVFSCTPLASAYAGTYMPLQLDGVAYATRPCCLQCALSAAML